MRTVDSDVVILALRWFASLGLSELWVCLGRGKKIRDMLIHTLSAQDHLHAWLYHFSMPSQVVTLCHASWDVARRQLGLPGKASLT